MASINGLPVYEALLEDEQCGMTRVSLVDEPAVMADFLTFKGEEQQQRYAVVDEERRLVWGVLMRADFPIYRRDERLGEYYIVYTAETIRTMAEKYLREGLANAVNLMHEQGSEVEGVEMVQLVIQDHERGIVPSGFDDIKDGSLFAEYHVTNDEVWAKIKSGEYRGFSIECTMCIEPASDEDAERAATSKVFSKQHKITMNKLKSMVLQLFSIVCKMRAISTPKGLLVWDGEDDLEIGTEVFIEGEDGERVPAPSDEYEDVDNNLIIVVVDGKVSELRPKEEPVEEPVPQENAEGDAPVEPAEPSNDAVAELAARVDRLEAQIAEMADLLGIVGEEMKKANAAPAAEPAHKAFKAEREEVSMPTDRRCRKALSIR